jgi:hypothetical protein
MISLSNLVIILLHRNLESDAMRRFLLDLGLAIIITKKLIVPSSNVIQPGNSSITQDVKTWLLTLIMDLVPTSTHISLVTILRLKSLVSGLKKRFQLDLDQVIINTSRLMEL